MAATPQKKQPYPFWLGGTSTALRNQAALVLMNRLRGGCDNRSVHYPVRTIWGVIECVLTRRQPAGSYQGPAAGLRGQAHDREHKEDL